MICGDICHTSCKLGSVNLYYPARTILPESYLILLYNALAVGCAFHSSQSTKKPEWIASKKKAAISMWQPLKCEAVDYFNVRNGLLSKPLDKDRQIIPF
jgi:hypothetical protein